MNDSGRHSAAPAPSGPGRPREEQATRTRTYLRWFMLLLLGALLTSGMVLPWKVLGLIFGLAALVMGLLSLVLAVQQKLPALLRISTAAGLVAAFFLTLGTGAQIALWPVTQQYETCMSTALTNTAKKACEDEVRNLGGLLPD